MELTHQNDIQQKSATTGTYSLRVLDGGDIKDMIALQERVGSDDIIKKTASVLAAHFNAGHTALGIEKDGALVAQTTIKADPMLPQTATIGFMMTDPAHRGQGLNDMLVGKALTHMGYNGFMVAQARVKIDNSSTAWKKFEKHGFSIIGQGESPDQKGRQVYTLQKTLSDEFLIAGNIAAAETAQHEKTEDMQPSVFAAPSV